MRLLYIEHIPDYSKYLFPYQVFAKKEETDTLDNIYNKGFLVTRFAKDLFVLARSIRINLSNFNLTSENRRILRKTDCIALGIRDINDFNYSPEVGLLASKFYKTKTEGTAFNAKSIERLIFSKIVNQILIYTDKEKNKPIGYCLIVKGEKFIHYAYPFYDLRYAKKNIGLGMMLKAAIWCKENNFDYIYLGTIYTKNSIYKLQFEGLEYFDGLDWKNDIDVLKNSINEQTSSRYYDLSESKTKLLKQKGII